MITTDMCSNPGIGPLSVDPGDVLFTYDVEGPTGDYQCLGVEFDGVNFWVTGGSAGGEPNKLYKFDDSGSLVDTFDQPSHTSGWGWRDLAYDGEYLYGTTCIKRSTNLKPSPFTSAWIDLIDDITST